MKCYIYCTKSKPNIGLNGKVVACFDLNKVEKMGLDTNKGLVFDSDYNKESCLTLKELVEYIDNNYYSSEELVEYIGNYYYAWYIENLEIFDKPMELRDFCKAIDIKTALKQGIVEEWEIAPLSYEDEEVKFVVCDLNKAPQSWCYALERYALENPEVLIEKCILISVKPEWVKKILNGEKTIEIRKTAPKELLK